MNFNETDDYFELQYKEQLEKKQKKQEKQKRLQQKNLLIEEMKNLFEEERRAPNEPTAPTKGSLEWALAQLHSAQNLSLAEMKKKYFNLAQKYHPDKNNGRDIQEMRDLNEAWEIIKTQYR